MDDGKQSSFRRSLVFSAGLGSCPGYFHGCWCGKTPLAVDRMFSGCCSSARRRSTRWGHGRANGRPEDHGHHRWSAILPRAILARQFYVPVFGWSSAVQSRYGPLGTLFWRLAHRAKQWGSKITRLTPDCKVSAQRRGGARHVVFLGDLARDTGVDHAHDYRSDRRRRRRAGGYLRYAGNVGEQHRVRLDRDHAGGSTYSGALFYMLAALAM